MSTGDRKKIVKVYQEALRGYPHGLKSYRWRYPQEQKIRFEELLKVAGSRGNLQHSSILDIGSGRGDLYQYLRNQLITVKYTGIDLMGEFITWAKKHYPKAKFIEKDFLTWQSQDRYDYVVASGLLSVRVSDNEKYLQRTLRKMLSLARRGVAFNFLTIFRREKFRRWYYYDPGRIFNWCAALGGIGRLTLQIGYDPVDQFGDATILLWNKLRI